MSKSVSKNPIDWNAALKEILSGGVTRTIVSVILGFAVGAFFMIVLAVSRYSFSTRDLPILYPSAFKNVLAIPPPRNK